MSDSGRTRPSFRVALISDSTSGFSPLIQDAEWQAKHRIEFPLIVEISPPTVCERLRRIRSRVTRQARINGTSPIHQLCAAVVYRLLLQPSGTDGHIASPSVATVAQVTSANDESAIAAIADAQVDAVVLLSADLLTADTIAAVHAPIYNVHDGDPRHVRGRPPFVWDIIDGRDGTLITFHEVEPKVDSGAIVHCQSAPITWCSSLRSTLRACETKAVRLRVEVIRQSLVMLRMGIPHRTDFEPGPVRTLPSFGNLWSASRRCRAAHRGSSSMRQY